MRGGIRLTLPLGRCILLLDARIEEGSIVYSLITAGVGLTTRLRHVDLLLGWWSSDGLTTCLAERCAALLSPPHASIASEETFCQHLPITVDWHSCFPVFLGVLDVPYPAVGRNFITFFAWALLFCHEKDPLFDILLCKPIVVHSW